MVCKVGNRMEVKEIMLPSRDALENLIRSGQTNRIASDSMVLKSSHELEVESLGNWVKSSKL